MNNYTLNTDNTYSRHNNQESNLLKEKLNKLYECNNINIVNSGLHANFLTITLIIQLLNKSEINLIYSSDLYYESIQIINYIKDINNNINIHIINILDDDNIINKFKYELNNKNNILFIESCTNPFGYIFNFDIIPQLRLLSNNLYVICDNSWLSNYIFNPFDYDVDIITLSLTKYYCNNKCIQGVCIIKSDQIYSKFDLYNKISGIHNSIFNLNIINANMELISDRINYNSILCKQILSYLITKNIIIYHPNISSHKSYNLANKYFKNNLYPSTFLIGFNYYIYNILEILTDLKIFKIEVSFASNNTKLDSHIFYKDNISYLRISIGYEDTIDNLYLGFDELIDKINNAYKYKLRL